jgi:hypothetical protein
MEVVLTIAAEVRTTPAVSLSLSHDYECCLCYRGNLIICLPDGWLEVSVLKEAPAKCHLDTVFLAFLCL